MLGEWRNHDRYQRYLIDNVNREFKHNPNSIAHFESAVLKMYCLDLDSVRDDFSPLFSPIGRPSNQQPEVFRSLILMCHFKYAGFGEWVSFAKSSLIVCALVGVTPDSFPGESTHRDFVSRLWAADDSNHHRKTRKKPGTKHGKDKLPPKHSGIIKYMVDKALSGKVFKRIPERLFQALFTKTALIPSAAMGLLGDTSKLISSADGTCISSNASSYGHKTCQCPDRCGCPRKFADPNAKWGWDSSNERWFFGYTAYLLSVHNPGLKLDLPIYLKFVEAPRNDGVSLVAALAHARYLYSGILSFDSLLADAAHDHYPIYDLLKQWDIKPFIDLNKRTSINLETQDIPLSKNGIPVCADGYEMTNWGFDKKKYRIKYRCPFSTGKVKFCFYASNCNKSLYGKIVYISLMRNLRLLTPIPRDTVEWKAIYNQRSAAERVNNRILTDYQLERPKRYGKKKLAFFAFFNAINVHLDAQVKFRSVSLQVLLG
jgi:hypothetical protein